MPQRLSLLINTYNGELTKLILQLHINFFITLFVIAVFTISDITRFKDGYQKWSALLLFTYANIRFSHDAIHMSFVVRKLVFGVSEKVQHKPGCTVTDDS